MIFQLNSQLHQCLPLLPDCALRPLQFVSTEKYIELRLSNNLTQLKQTAGLFTMLYHAPQPFRNLRTRIHVLMISSSQASVWLEDLSTRLCVPTARYFLHGTLASGHVLAVVLSYTVTVLPTAQIKEVVSLLTKSKELIQEVDNVGQVHIRLFLNTLIFTMILYGPGMQDLRVLTALSCKSGAWTDSFPTQADEIDAIVQKFE
ncbi:TPA: hypothetical protein ACH3X1_001347 [Trebouxia sp. C0004]